ncbi:MAG: crossover junction endodeoxyribonuclease RuvC [Balneolaceae bacterium]|nr:crossover junction endodeoxyribonuclease RuvC [Balneolaceae bacterium]
MPDIILGIDPGSRNTGYAILTEENNQLKALRCDTIRLASIEEHPERLKVIYDRISKLIRSFTPTALAVETPVYGVDPLAMLKLGRAQAAIMLAGANQDIPIAEYYPKEVKKSITGNGNASKQQVAFMLKKTVQLSEETLSNDATDALAVAWCHLMKSSSLQGRIPAGQKKRHQNRSNSSWAEFVKENPDRISE